MLCEICKKQYAKASRNVDRGFGEMRVAVCRDCANMIDKREQNLDFTNDFWGDPKKLTQCNVCGTTLESILQSGYVGCVNCYKVFSKEISELVNNIQGKNVHVGKVPQSVLDKKEVEVELGKIEDTGFNFGDFGLSDIVKNHFPGRRR